MCQKNMESNIDQLPHQRPNWGPEPQPRHVPWLGIKPGTFPLAGRCSTEPHQPGLQTSFIVMITFVIASCLSPSHLPPQKLWALSGKGLFQLVSLELGSIGPIADNECSLNKWIKERGRELPTLSLFYAAFGQRVKLYMETCHQKLYSIKQVQK